MPDDRVKKTMANPVGGASSSAPVSSGVVDSRPSDPWWVRIPERLEYELQALDASQVPYERDEAAFAAGVARLNVHPEIDGERLDLVVTFPDLYPYFRFFVQTEQLLGLTHHHAPIRGGPLCLLERPTEAWHTTDTVAGLLQTQLPYVLAAGRSDDREAVTNIEAHQAEPFSTWYNYAPAMLQIDGAWVIPDDASHGEFVAHLPSVRSGDDRTPMIHGVVVEVRDQKNRIIAEADHRLREAYTGDRWVGRWTRSAAPVEVSDPTALFTAAATLDQPHTEPPWGPAAPLRNAQYELQLQMRAVLFPEEHAWRDHTGQGWVFIVRSRSRRLAAVPNNSKFIRPSRISRAPADGWRDAYAITRAGRSGPRDLERRVPELAPLQHAQIAIVGLGCIGAPSTLEFARSQVGELRLMDGDVVDPGTVVRWPFGLSVAGWPKVQVLQNVITRDYPYTRVQIQGRTLGAVREPVSDDTSESDQEALERFTAGIGLLYDASAEFGVQYFLSEFARDRGIPYISVTGTPGGWGGRIVRIRPGVTKGCWTCMQMARIDGSLPDSPADPHNTLQPAGCADPTFTAAGFDMTTIAMHGVRLAVSTLCDGGAGAYPSADWDVAIIALRDEEGRLIAPTVRTFPLERHQSCPVCAARE